MSVWLGALLAIVGMHVVAWALWPILTGRSERVRVATASVIALLLPFAGLIIKPPEARVMRAFVAIIGLILAARLYSYWTSARRRGLGDYVWFLSFGLLQPHFVYSPTGYAAHMRPPIGREVLRFALGIAAGIAMAFAIYAILQFKVATRWWLVNYLAVMALFLVMMQAFGQASWALWQVQGIRSRALVDNVWVSRTPAEFWRRWSWPVHFWLNRYVYMPCGGRQHAASAIFIAFLVSGIAHEVIAGVGLRRITGHQLAYFLISGLGVIASGRLLKLERFGLAGEIVMRAVTILFLVASGVLMFATFTQFVDVFRLPSWLNW
jgi:hypothetical protein